MRVYHQIYDAEHINKLYGMEGVDVNTLPTGYGAIPYSHGFIRNKMTPHPWGVKLPAVYSQLANAGTYFIDDLEHTDIYDSEDITSRTPFSYGPVNAAYTVTISGIKNHTSATNPSGCSYCNDFNRDYKVSQILTETNFPEAILRRNISWRSPYPAKFNTYPRGINCYAGAGQLGLTLSYGQSPSNTGVGVDSGNILLGFGFSVAPQDPANDIFTYGNYSPFLFVKDFGSFDVINKPTINYQNKPKMMDDVPIVLPPATGQIWYSYQGAPSPMYNSYINYNQNFSCDTSSAVCTITPYKRQSLYSPQDALYNFLTYEHFPSNRYLPESFDIDDINNTIETNKGFYSGIYPTTFVFNMTPVPAITGDFNCETCSGYYSRERTLIPPSFMTFIPPLVTNYGYESGFFQEINGTTPNASGFFVSSYIWDGRSYSTLSDIQVDNVHYKTFLNNFSNICEFGCDDVNVLSSNGLKPNNKYCNNFFFLDEVRYYTSKINGTTTLEFDGWQDAYLYFGQANSDNYSQSIYSPYRFKKRICDDRTGNPRRCTDPIPSGGVYIHGVSGILDPNIPFYSGGWTYEKWTAHPYEPFLGTQFVQTMVDISGLCDFSSVDIILKGNIDHNNVVADNGDYCVPCNDNTYPTNATVTINNGDDSYILNSYYIFQSHLDNVPGSVDFHLHRNNFLFNTYDFCHFKLNGNSCFGANETACSGCAESPSSVPSLYLDGISYEGDGRAYLLLSGGPFTSGNTQALHNNSTTCIQGPSLGFCTNDNWTTNTKLYIDNSKAIHNNSIDCSQVFSSSGNLDLICGTGITHFPVVFNLKFGGFKNVTDIL